MGVVVSEKITLYDLLGLSEQEARSAARVRKNFRKLSLRLHPDKLEPFRDDSEGRRRATELFINVVKAYEILSDPEKAGAYRDAGAPDYRDSGEAVPARPASYPSPFELDALFEQGGLRFRAGKESGKGAPDIFVSLRVPFCSTWGTRPFKTPAKIARRLTCPECGGMGAASHESVEMCQFCGGTGMRHYLYEGGDDEDGGGCRPLFTQSVGVLCDKCNGRGKAVIRNRCQACSGTGEVTEQDVLDVNIPAGATDEYTKVLQGQGHRLSGAPAGNVIIVLRWLTMTRRRAVGVAGKTTSFSR